MFRQIIKIVLLLPLFFVIYQQVDAQQIPTVSGLVLEKETGSRVAEVNVVNLANMKRVVTNTYGAFFIEASVGDTLSLSRTGFGSIKTVLYTMGDLVLEMNPGIHIETVVISRRTRQEEMADIMRDFEKKGIYNGGKNKVGTYVNSPATALYNLFGREAKNMKRFEKFMDREVDEIQLDRIFSKTKVSEITGLSGDELQSFMDLYRPSLTIAQSWGQYDLLEYVNRNFKKWDADGRPASQKLPKLTIPEMEK